MRIDLKPRFCAARHVRILIVIKTPKGSCNTKAVSSQYVSAHVISFSNVQQEKSSVNAVIGMLQFQVILKIFKDCVKYT